jgi:threonine/homoserine/homoserine lactone efflux protein
MKRGGNSRIEIVNVLEFLFATLILELTPGPNMAYLVALTLARGRIAGLIATAGVATGLAVHAVAAALGAGTLIERFPAVYETLRWVGVAYLLYLAWEGWKTVGETSPVRTDTGTDAGPLFLRGFLSNVFNPKSILFFVSVVPSFIVGDAKSLAIPLQMGLLGILYVAVATGVHTAIVLLAGQLRPWLVAGPHRDLTRRVLSLALAFVAIWLAWTTHRG